jgi:NAD(P)H dehydrogenase (quinone)
VRKLGRLTIHLVMLAGDDAEGFRRRGYDTAISTQIVTGVLGYCGARTGVIATVHESEDRPPAGVQDEVRAVAASIADAAQRDRRPAEV